MACTTKGQPDYLGYEEVSKLLHGQWSEIISVVESALKSYSAGKVVQPVRAAVPVEKHDGILFAMPAYDAERDALAAKLVSVFPGNKARGLSAVQAVVLLYDATTGGLKAIMDGETITNMRTAAASAVATKLLAPKRSEYLAILGAGAQARSHFQALAHLYSFKKVFVWNINAESGAVLVQEINQKGVQCQFCETVEEAVKKADIIVTVTMATKPILRKEWVKPGAHINAVGAPVPTWQELAEDLVLDSVVYVDSREGAESESGDIIKSKAKIYAEIGEVILGAKEAFPEKTTIFKSLGMAVEDVAAAELVYKNYKTSQ